MPTLKLGFALEGNSDLSVIPVLARRTLANEFPDLELATEPPLRPRKRGHGFIKELPVFARQMYDAGAAVIVAVVDTDNTRIGERRSLLRAAIEQCRAQQIPVCIAEGLAVHSLEAWLLADEQAIYEVFDGDLAQVQFSNPEADQTPKATLNQIVRTLTNGREVTFANFAEELAEAIRLNILRQRCPQFDEFARNLVNCARAWRRSPDFTIGSPAPSGSVKLGRKVLKSTSPAKE